MIKKNSMIKIVVISLVVTGGVFYYQTTHKWNKYLSSPKPEIWVPYKTTSNWEFKHCTPTNKNCGRFE